MSFSDIYEVFAQFYKSNKIAPHKTRQIRWKSLGGGGADDGDENKLLFNKDHMMGCLMVILTGMVVVVGDGIFMDLEEQIGKNLHCFWIRHLILVMS